MDQNIIRGQGEGFIAGGGSSYNAGLSVYDTVLVDGGKYFLKFDAASYEGITLNINGTGSKPIYKPGLVKINYGDLIAGRWYEFTYNLSLDAFEINLPKIICAQYDFSVLTGVIGTYNLTSDIPTGIILYTRKSQTITTTDFTSAGNALISIGVTSVPDLIDATKPYKFNGFSGSGNIVSDVNSLPYGSFQLTAGAGGSVDTVTVAGVNILNAPTAFSGSLAATAAFVCTSINTNPGHNIRAFNSGAVIYLYHTNIRQVQNSFSGAAAEYAVSATSTTLTVGNFVDIGGANVARNNYNAGYYVPSAKKITFTISGANLTAGKIRVYIPYEVYT